MQSRPTQPTSALAALIAGNHRHLELRARGAVAPQQLHGQMPSRPFALVFCPSRHAAAIPVIFAADLGDIVVVETIAHVAAHAERGEVRLLVAIEPFDSGAEAGAWCASAAEERAFASVDLLVEASPDIRRAVAEGSMRVVAALLEHPAERVHWLGERRRNGLGGG